MKAIVYTSNTGHTEAYSKILAEQTGLPVYDLKSAVKNLEKGTEVIYLGWLFANSVKGHKKCAKKYKVSAVCAVGLCDTGTAVSEVRKVNRISDNIPLFTMQGGMDKGKLNKGYLFGINMLIKMMSKKKDPTEDDRRMLYLLANDKDYVCKENTADFMAWYNKNT